MKNIKNILFVAIGTLMLSSCAVTTPYAVTGNPIGSKVGVSSTISLFTTPALPGGNTGFGIRLNGNWGLAEATKNGKINKVATVDIKRTSYVLFSKMEMVVTGE